MTEENQEVVIKVFPLPVARLEVTYRNKEELFAKYKEWIKSLNLPSNEVYWCDSGGDHTGIRNADDLLGAVQEQGAAKFFTPMENDDEGCWCDPDVQTGKKWVPRTWKDINPKLTLQQIDCGCEDCVGPNFYQMLSKYQ